MDNQEKLIDQIAHLIIERREIEEQKKVLNQKQEQIDKLLRLLGKEAFYSIDNKDSKTK